MLAMSWFAALWTLTTMFLMSRQYYRVAWCSSIASQGIWITIGVRSDLPGMAALGICMVFIGVQALLRLRAT